MRVVYVYINFIFILVIMQVYRDYLSRGAHRYSSLLADLQVHNVPTHPALFGEDNACSHWFSWGGGGVLLVLTRLMGVSARLCWLLWGALHSMLSAIANQRRSG